MRAIAGVVIALAVVGCGGASYGGSVPELPTPTPTLQPTCVPQCSGKACGPDNCGGVCGSCAAGSRCDGSACLALVAEGGDCRANLECAPGLICRSDTPLASGHGSCLRLMTLGGQCAGDADCASGICDSALMYPAGTRACAPTRAACLPGMTRAPPVDPAYTTPILCCAPTAEWFTPLPAQDDAICDGCARPGRTCSEHYQCCSGVCEGRRYCL